MNRIALLAGALTLAALVDVQPGRAYYNGPWCAYELIGKGGISSRCDLKSYEACRAWMNASSGTWCTRSSRRRRASAPSSCRSSVPKSNP